MPITRLSPEELVFVRNADRTPEKEQGWIRRGLHYAVDNPRETAEIIAKTAAYGGAIAYDLAPPDGSLSTTVVVLGKIAKTVTNYTIYEAVKKTVSKVAKTVTDHPYIFSALFSISALTLYHKGLVTKEVVTQAAEIAWEGATLPNVKGVVAVGLFADYMKSCYLEKTLRPQPVREIMDGISHPIETCANRVRAVRQKLGDTYTNVSQTVENASEDVWNNSGTITLVGAAATGTTFFLLRDPSYATILAIATTVPGFITLCKAFA